MSYLGIDFGTSGCRAIAIGRQGNIEAEARRDLPPPQRDGKSSSQDPQLWWQALLSLLQSMPEPQALAIDGTSATLLLCDAELNPLAPAMMYDDASASSEAQRIAEYAPASSATRSAASSLAKYLALRQSYPHFSHALHQADWLSNRLCACAGVSDENNALKLGYDVEQRRWPDWLAQLEVFQLPRVVPPGTPIGRLRDELRALFGWRASPWIISGTTDSTAAFIASGAQTLGDAVTTLGSTLVMKILSDTPVNAPEYGIYSHRLGERWLVGGASNSGGAVLRQYFSSAQLAALTPQLTPRLPTRLDYYPLLRPGERFPIADADYLPRLQPRPDDDVVFFQAMLEGMARIEASAYAKLQQLGASPLRRVYTCGGGAINEAWRAMREGELGVPISIAPQTEAAYGSALLALRGMSET
jgi:sugar (pentulose or hexulose) kinase